MPRGRPRKSRGADAPQTGLVSNSDQETNNLYRRATQKCDICLITFPKESLYQRHMREHEKNDKPYRCDQCPMSFNSEFNLTLHKSTHNLNDASCPVCQKNFSRVASLKTHIMSHMKEETFVCTECGDEFILQSQLTRHMEEHQQEAMGKKTYSCKSCEETFETPLQLKDHMKTHIKIRVVRARSDSRNIDRSGFRYSCPHCDKKFKRRDQVTCHVMIHTGEKPFKCTLCRKAFIQKSVLVTHMATHTGEKPHTCSLCPAAFSQKGTLQSHIQKVHSEVTNGVLFHCTHCSCAFKSIGSRSRHINKMHGEGSQESSSTEGASQMTPARVTVSETECISNKTSIECGHEQGQANHDKMDKCIVENSTTADSACEGNGTKHNICTYCNKEFKKPSCLVKHIRIHTHEKPFKCSECFRAFASKGNLTAHMKTHTGVKAFKCNFCMKCFSTSGSLKVHIRLHTGETPYACPHCDKRFKTYGLRETHITTHLTPSELKTLREQRKLRKVCPRKPIIPVSEITLEEPILVSKLGLIQPIPRGRQFIQDALSNSYAYEVDRPHKCCYCPRAYKKSCELKLHIRYHTGEKPYKCTQCGRAFPSSGSLKIHMRTHTGLKPYKCLKCNRAFSTSGCLRRHMVIHNDLRSYMCPYCQKTFKTFPNCKSHLRTHRYEVARQLQQQMTASEENSDQNNVSDPVKMETEDNVLPLNVATQQNPTLQSALDTGSPSVGQDFTDEPLCTSVFHSAGCLQSCISC